MDKPKHDAVEGRRYLKRRTSVPNSYHVITKQSDEIERLRTELKHNEARWQSAMHSMTKAIDMKQAELDEAYGRTEKLLIMAKSGLYGSGNIWKEAGYWFDKDGKAIRGGSDE